MTPMSAERKAQAVVFDMDGLMFNTEDLYDLVGEELLRRRGQQFTAELKRLMMGRPSPVALQMMIERHQLADPVAQLEAESDEIFAGLLPTRLAPMPGLEELLSALERAGIRKAVATSSRRGFTQTVLGQFAYERRFQFLLTAEDVRQGKPHPEIYQTAAARLGLTPQRMLVLEDSENGCRAALAAGAITVAVPSAHSAQHDFQGVAFVAAGLADPRIYGVLGLSVPAVRG